MTEGRETVLLNRGAPFEVGQRGIPSQSRGYTLIEILIVIAVMAIAMALATMSMGTLRSTSLSTATRQFADYLNLCRSQAIARHTAIRVGIVVKSDNPGDSYRRYSAWVWNKKRKTFEPLHAWKRLPGELVFEPKRPDYLKESIHAKNDASSVRGDYFLEGGANDFVTDEAEVVRFIEFNPAGRAEVSSSDLRNVIVCLRPGDARVEFDGSNWAQFNIDTLTGRVRIYRP